MSDNRTPVDVAATPAASRWLAIAALVASLGGVLLVVLFYATSAGTVLYWAGGVLGLLGLILGIVALRKQRSKALAVVGLVVGAVVVVAVLGMFLFALLFIGAFTVR